MDTSPSILTVGETRNPGERGDGDAGNLAVHSGGVVVAGTCGRAQVCGHVRR